MVMFNAPSDQVVGETAMGPIHGWVKAGYEPVLTAFADNFEHRGEVGASLCILSGDQTLIDVFAGTSIDGGQPWQRETISVVHSCTKAAVSLCSCG